MFCEGLTYFCIPLEVVLRKTEEATVAMVGFMLIVWIVSLAVKAVKKRRK